jgi:Bacterial regulatory helix-turn-helix protein, lysR family
MSLSRSEPLQPGRVVDTVAIDPLKFDGVAAFARVVEAGSFSAAARRLRIFKSATSAHVQRLEERLGVRLHRGWRCILSALRPHRRRSGIRRAGSARAAA